MIIVLLAWETSSRLALINPYFIPAPTVLAVRAYELTASGELLKHMGTTLWRALASLALAVVVGVPLGIAVARVRPVKWFFDPLISLGFPTPKVALWPIFVLWFGFHDLSKILLTAFACVFNVVSATYLATGGVDKYLIWSARNMGTTENRLLWKIIFRAAFPEILTGIQTALPVAFVVMVLSEMLSGGLGLGAMIMVAGRFADMKTVLVGIVAAALLGFTVFRLVEFLRSRLLAWHEETSVHA